VCGIQLNRSKASSKSNRGDCSRCSLALGSLGGGLGSGLLGSDLSLLVHGGLLLDSLLSGLCGFLDLAHELGLAGNSLLLTDVVLGSAGLSLGGEFGSLDGVLLHLVDGLDQHVLVLELVTLGAEVELVVDVLVDLLGFTVLAEEASQNADSAHPEDVRGHTGIAGTLALTSAVVAA